VTRHGAGGSLGEVRRALSRYRAGGLDEIVLAGLGEHALCATCRRRGDRDRRPIGATEQVRSAIAQNFVVRKR
jgi:hypothetical protein